MTFETKGGSNRKPVSQLIVAIDGPTAAGKSTVGKLVAKRLGLLFINTGAMYRALAYKAAREGIDLEDSDALTRLANHSQIELTGDPDHARVSVDGEDVTTAIRTPTISRLSSVISTVSGVRRAMVISQRRMCERGGVVLEGRDIGTHVFPQADIKIFLGADPEIRAQRRWEEERNAGHESTLSQLKQEIVQRDSRDENRHDSPLRPAEDAVFIDSSSLGVDEVVERILELIRGR